MSEYLDQLAESLRSQDNNGGNQNPPQPPAGNPPAGDPPAAPPATPPSNDPPAAPPAGDPPAAPPAAKEWYEDPATPPAPPTGDPPAKDTKEPEFQLDDDIKLILEYKKSGKTLNDFVKEYQVEDLTKVTDDDIVKRGITEFMGLSAEEQEQAVYEYENASIFQKKEWARSMRERYEQKNQEKLKQLTGDNAKYADMQKAAYQRYQEEVEQFVSQIADKELYGLKVSPEMVKELRNYAENEITFQRPDGTYDIEKLYSVAMWLKYGKEIVKANVTKARNEGKEQIIKEVTNPSANTTGGGRVVGSGLEAVQEAFASMFPG
jgi:hypothetical protein